MKYQDILQDVLTGKLVREAPNKSWKKMKESGLWDDDPNRPDFSISKDRFSFDTWEVKPEALEEIRIVIESVDKPRGHTPSIGAFVVGGSVEVHQRYKLIPVDEEIKGSRAQVNRDKEYFNQGRMEMWKLFSKNLFKLSFSGSVDRVLKDMINGLEPE